MWHAILTLYKIYGRTTSDKEFQRDPWTAHTVGRSRVWHAIVALGQHTRSKELGRGILSSLLDRTYFRTTSRVGCLHGPWVAHSWTVSGKACHLLPWTTLDRTTSGVTFHHCPWKAHSDGQYYAWHAIIALGIYASRTTSEVAFHHRTWIACTVG